jgi:hypothetical protein
MFFEHWDAGGVSRQFFFSFGGPQSLNTQNWLCYVLLGYCHG